MSRKDNNTEEEVPEQAQPAEGTPVQLVSDSQLINIKLDRIIELLSQQ